MDVIDVAEYVLSRTGTISPMKLHKLAYYTQAWSLAWTELPLFQEDFEAWATGPVCPELFDAHGDCREVSETRLRADAEILPRGIRDLIDAVLDFYGEQTIEWLTDMTQVERPWRLTRGSIAPGEPCFEVISKDLIRDSYTDVWPSPLSPNN